MLIDTQTIAQIRFVVALTIKFIVSIDLITFSDLAQLIVFLKLLSPFLLCLSEVFILRNVIEVGSYYLKVLGALFLDLSSEICQLLVFFE